MNVMSRKTLPALLTGNTVVFKPATFTPWSGVFMAQLFERAGLPAGVFNCVTGPGSKIGNVIVQDTRVRAITFTGSTEVGKKIQVKGSANLTRMQLELGGKNAVIVATRSLRCRSAASSNPEPDCPRIASRDWNSSWIGKPSTCAVNCAWHKSSPQLTS